MGRREAKSALLFSNELYDGLNRLVQYVLPGFGTLYFTLAQIWGFPRGEEVIGTCAALAIFLGIAIGISTKSYNASGAKYDGAMVVNGTDPDKDVYRLEVNVPLEELRDKKELILKVVPPTS